MEGVEPATAYLPRFGQPLQYRQQPGPEGDFLRTAIRAESAQTGRGEVKTQAQLAVEMVTKALQEIGFGIEAGDFIFVLGGE